MKRKTLYGLSILTLVGLFFVGYLNTRPNSAFEDFMTLQSALHALALEGNYSKVPNTALITSDEVPPGIFYKRTSIFGPKGQDGKASTFRITGTGPFITVVLSPVNASLCSDTVEDLINSGLWVTVNGKNVAETLATAGTSISRLSRDLCAKTGNKIVAVTN